MIKSNNVVINGKELTHIYSDLGVMLSKNGTDEIYSEVYDLPVLGFTYIETDIPIRIEVVKDEINEIVE